MVKQWPGNGVMTCDPDEWFVLAADYIALEARCRELEAALAKEKLDHAHAQMLLDAAIISPGSVMETKDE
jgi:hypothetical protein